MKRTSFLLPILLGVAVGTGIHAIAPTDSRIVSASSMADVSSVSADYAGAKPVRHVVLDTAKGMIPLSPRDPSRAEVRRRIRAAAKGTYVNELLLDRDSALTRWPDRTDNPLRVWIRDGAEVADWEPDFASRVREAFSAWMDVGLPVRFVFVNDSANADINVRFIDRFDEAISGKTVWARDNDWWIVDGSLTLALHHNTGRRLDAAAIHAIALHEVGHLIGLDHTSGLANIMTPKVRVRELSDADRATARLLYSLPPGSVRSR